MSMNKVEINDLRSAIEYLKDIKGQLVKSDVEVNPHGELAGVYRYVGAGGTVKRPTKIGPAMIFNNITQIKINGFLDSLKKMKIARPLSAVVTETTIDWTLNKLVYNLIQERKAIQSGTTLNH